MKYLIPLKFSLGDKCYNKKSVFSQSIIILCMSLNILFVNIKILQ